MAKIEETIARDREGRDTGLQVPADSWTRAMAFYTSLAQETALDTVAGMLRRDKDRGARVDGAADSAPVQRWLYAKLRQSEQPTWERYLEARLRKRGWDTQGFPDRLRALPRSLPPAHRWHLLRCHFNGHMSTDRVSKGTADVEVAMCAFCGCWADTYAHLHECDVLRDARRECRACTCFPERTARSAR